MKIIPSLNKIIDNMSIETKDTLLRKMVAEYLTEEDQKHIIKLILEEVNERTE